MMAGCGSITNAEILALLFAIAPQFATTDPAKLAGYNSLIDALRCMINCQVLGCCAALAFANLLAHYLTMQGNQYLGVGTNISEGQLSLGLSATINANAFASTPYGQQYLNILAKFRVGALVTNVGPRWYGPSCGCGY
jgi:hypothetical protein